MELDGVFGWHCIRNGNVCEATKLEKRISSVDGDTTADNPVGQAPGRPGRAALTAHLSHTSRPHSAVESAGRQKDER